MKYSVTSSLGIHALTGLNVRTVWSSRRGTQARGALILGSRYRFAPRWSIGANLLVPNLFPTASAADVAAGILITVGHGFM